MGAFQEKEDDGLEYITCTFTFDSINLATGLNVILKGQNPLILKTRNHGNISLGTALSADGGDSTATMHPSSKQFLSELVSLVVPMEAEK